jgi:subtilisin family serine protease
MRNGLLILLLLCFTAGYAQHTKINFALKLALEKEPNQHQLFPLFVIGDVNLISKEVNRLQGKVIRSYKNNVQIELPVGVIDQFSKNTFVQSLPYSFSKGTTLSDTMTIHNNITPIHNGVSPLLQNYTGKGVVFGIIDTGHDIVHPDFKDSLGNTRIYRIWDQVAGLTWDSTSINNATCTHTDYSGVDHGTHVSGIAAGNGLGLNKYGGVVPEATIVVVASDFNAPNWLATVVNAVDYIFNVADSLNMPCVINASIGDYYGSHDGTDPAAYLIDSIVNYKSGRAFVCAAGNAGHFNWHVEQIVTPDTSFSWLKYNPTSALGFGSVFFEVWSDTADFNNVDYAFGANLPSGTFEERARTSFVNIKNRLGTFSDTLRNGSNIIGIVETYGELQGDKYLLQVLLNEPDSNTYNFSFLSTGSGKFDFWTTSALGTSNVVQSPLPSISQYPPIAFYTLPDSAKTTVSSFSCSPNILTVANFNNRQTYYDVDSILRVNAEQVGKLANSSSRGPDRRGNIKPDIGATGNLTIGPNDATTIAANMASTPANRAKVALGGMHRVNGGTSMASPVVAGVAALYLQKCPTATMAEIKAAIENTGKQDSFTGTLPNFQFGYGKINGFAALNNSNYSLTLGNDVTVCDDDSVSISANGYTSYNWSTGDTINPIVVDTTKQVYVTVTNISGCKAISDTINVTWRPLPTKPILTLLGNDTLLYSTNNNLQWYFNNGAISGETDTIHIAQNNGDYFVEVTDSFGCKNTSDTLTLTTVGINEFNANGLSIYPNPTNGFIKIKSDETIELITVRNVLGELILITKSTELSISSQPDGIYFVEVLTKKGRSIKKVQLSK